MSEILQPLPNRETGPARGQSCENYKQGTPQLSPGGMHANVIISNSKEENNTY